MITRETIGGMDRSGDPHPCYKNMCSAGTRSLSLSPGIVQKYWGWGSLVDGKYCRKRGRGWERQPVECWAGASCGFCWRNGSLWRGKGLLRGKISNSRGRFLILEPTPDLQKKVCFANKQRKGVEFGIGGSRVADIIRGSLECSEKGI